ncbi:C3a anaphylatoxin chemotactic receptor [Danio rerio]|uniref:C3a anaphylatoxin chemotactic receptor n=1 Tax=Danio rerio TaxID=7955 RepID=X1WGH4_DANRE|nr:C3a anaphylatoxin chemotactic receptor-like [Danio rerio]|eukprot:XP_005173460.1 C3a anaphylatoxin chemotactic receptor-like [Danio rerio]
MANNTMGLNNTMQQELTATEIFNICITTVIFAVGIIGNALVIYVTGYKMKTTVNSIWFLNLAIADFIFILFLILTIFTLINKRVWYFGDFMCKLASFVSVLNMFASIFLLTAISLDRCMSTWWIVWAQNKRTLFKGRIICAFVWVLSICCSIPFVICRSGENKTCKYNPGTNINFLFTYRFIVGFLIPFLVIASSYIAIGVRAKRLKRGKKLKPFRVILSVILAFFICWLPFHLQQLITAMTKGKDEWSGIRKVLYNIGPFVGSLAYFNSCLNPILYVFMCEEFKKKLKQSLLLVLETAFAEDLPFRTRQSTCSAFSESQGLQQPNDATFSSSASSQDNKTTL